MLLKIILYLLVILTFNVWKTTEIGLSRFISETPSKDTYTISELKLVVLFVFEFKLYLPIFLIRLTSKVTFSVKKYIKLRVDHYTFISLSKTKFNLNGFITKF